MLLERRKTDEKEAEKGSVDPGCHTACIFYLLSGTFFNGICRSKICFSGNRGASADHMFGRHFCGYACAFGSLGDAMYELTVFIRQKVFHKKGRHGYPEKAVRILQKVKYILLAFLLLSILTGWYASLQGMSPWDVFSMLTARKLPNASYKIGIILLVLILIGMCTQERFFCQFLCPMGAVFAMMPILPSALFNRNREKCPSKCGLCRKRCPAHLEIDGDTPLSGECICCHACQVTCPRKNIQIGPIDTAQEEQ
mgnify:CR=1 FL=1